jgi:hypothetical protein
MNYKRILIKTIAALVLSINLNCNTMNHQEFNVFGDKELLNNCKINVFTTDETGATKQMTLLENGLTNSVPYEIEIAEMHSLYISYQKTKVNVLKFENVFRKANDQISNLYLTKKDDVITIIFVGREAEIPIQKGFKTVLLPIDDYFKKQNITDSKEVEEQKQLFFGTYQ